MIDQSADTMSRARAFRPKTTVMTLPRVTVAAHTTLSLPHRERIAKLDANESGRVPSPRVRAALADCLTRADLNWYPDATAAGLKAALAEYAGVGSERIRVFPGADAALAAVVHAFLEPGDEVVWSPPSYAPFRTCVESVGGALVPAQTLSIWEPEPGAMLTSITSKTRLVYLANPNNPTGTLYSSDQIAALLWACPDVGFIVDEVYYEYSGTTVAPLLAAHNNLLIVRSFSAAFGLAGLRVGYVLSHSSHLAWLDRIDAGAGCSGLAQTAACAALADQEYLQATVAEARLAMKSLAASLVQMGLTVRTTPANFLLVNVDDPEGVSRFLTNRLIFVGLCDRIDGLSDHLRITVGDTRTVERVIEAFRAMPSALLFPQLADRHRMTLARVAETPAGEGKSRRRKDPVSRSSPRLEVAAEDKARV
jgi:histidinol-phosphate aminotransferase